LETVPTATLAWLATSLILAERFMILRAAALRATRPGRSANRSGKCLTPTQVQEYFES
jgi:hypothetical protein